jgi:hypothetical protein
MSHLERVLRDLEVATAAVAGEELAGGRAKLKRRSEAISRLDEVREAILSLGPGEFQDVISRLTRAASAGESAQKDLVRLKQTMMAEWSRWNQVHQALAAGGRRASSKIDCTG